MSISIPKLYSGILTAEAGRFRNYLRVEQPLPSVSKVDRGQEVAGCGGEGAGVFMT